MKNKTLVLLIIGMCYSGAAFADFEQSTFPYSKFKNIDVGNDYLQNNVRLYLNTLQKNEINFNKEINELNNKYKNTINREERQIAYKKDKDKRISMYSIYKREETVFNKFYSQIISKYVIATNDLIKNIKTIPTLSNEEKVDLLVKIRPILLRFKSASDYSQNEISWQKKACFDKELKNNGMADIDYCNSLYESANTLEKGILSNIKPDISEMLNKYKLDAIKANDAENLKRGIELLRRGM